jgi:glutathione S-transferase
MMKLHGVLLSNYYSIVKNALIEKNVSFEEAMSPPSQDPKYLAMSPMGKVPCIETSKGFLTETHPILDYLEDVHPQPALLPTDPFERAKVREITQAIELYVELVARRGIFVLFGRDVPDSVKTSIKEDLPKGIAAVRRLAKFSPWIAGPQFTYADLFGYWSFSLVVPLGKQNAGIDVFAEMPGAQAWFDRVAARDSVKRVLAGQEAARKARG